MERVYYPYVRILTGILVTSEHIIRPEPSALITWSPFTIQSQHGWMNQKKNEPVTIHVI